MFGFIHYRDLSNKNGFYMAFNGDIVGHTTNNIIHIYSYDLGGCPEMVYAPEYPGIFMLMGKIIRGQWILRYLRCVCAVCSSQ